MPRQGRSGGARSGPRPSTTPTRPAPVQQQTRPVSAAAYPPANTKGSPPSAPLQAQGQAQGPSLFGQMASTAAGVAVGSSIGHAIGGFFGGGSNTVTEQQSAATTQGQEQAQNNWGPKSCEADAKLFTKCLDDNQGNMQICGWYLDQLRACQATAGQY